MYPAVCFHPYSGRHAAFPTVFFSGLFLSEYTKPTPHSSFCLSGAFSILSRYKQLEQITVNISFPFPKPVLSDPIFLSLSYYNIFFFCCHYTYGINLQPLHLRKPANFPNSSSSGSQFGVLSSSIVSARALSYARAFVTPFHMTPADSPECASSHGAPDRRFLRCRSRPQEY